MSASDEGFDETYVVADSGMTGCRIMSKYSTGLFGMTVEIAKFPPSMLEWAHELVERMNAPVWFVTEATMDRESVWSAWLMKDNTIVVTITGKSKLVVEANAKLLVDAANEHGHLYCVEN